LTRGLYLHLAELRRVQVTGMRIEAGQHAIDRILDQGLVGDRIDVFEAHPLKGIAKQCEQLVGISPVTALGESGVDAEPDMPCDQTRDRADCHTSQEDRAEHQGGAETSPGIAHTHLSASFFHGRALPLAPIATIISPPQAEYNAIQGPCLLPLAASKGFIRTPARPSAAGPVRPRIGWRYAAMCSRCRCGMVTFCMALRTQPCCE
jgi:hypothetical protein